MLLLLLLLHPSVLLSVGDHFEGQAAHVEQDADQVRDADGGGQRREERDGEGVEGQDGHQAQRHPGRLRDERAQELGRGLPDVVEAGVGSVGGDALEEVGSHCRVAEICGQPIAHRRGRSCTSRVYVPLVGGFFGNSHLVAHTLTAALSTTCLQFSPAPLAPRNAPRMLGQAGLIAPAAAAACRALIVGR